MMNSEKVIQKTLIECLFICFYSKHIMYMRKKKIRNIDALHEHFLYYQGEYFYKLLFNSKKIPYIRKIIRFYDIKKLFLKNNIAVYYKDITTRDILPSGLKIVKVVMPGFIDLNRKYSLIRKDARRFNDVPRILGLKTPKTFRMSLHPFP